MSVDKVENLDLGEVWRVCSLLSENRKHNQDLCSGWLTTEMCQAWPPCSYRRGPTSRLSVDDEIRIEIIPDYP